MRTRSIGIVAGVLIVCLNTAFAQSPTPGFSSATTTLAATTDPAGSGPDWAATGDLNGGGKPDMVRVANAASNNMNFDARVATLEKQLVAQEKELQSLKDELALLKRANSTATDAPTDAQREAVSYTHLDVYKRQVALVPSASENCVITRLSEESTTNGSVNPCLFDMTIHVGPGFAAAQSACAPAVAVMPDLAAGRPKHG